MDRRMLLRLVVASSLSAESVACAGASDWDSDSLSETTQPSDEDGGGELDSTNDQQEEGDGDSSASSTSAASSSGDQDASSGDEGSDITSGQDSSDDGTDEGGEASNESGSDSRRRVPAEWEPQAAIWLQWPQRWERAYEPGLAKVVAKILDHEDVYIIHHDARTRNSAIAALTGEGGLDAAVAEGAKSSAGFQINWLSWPNDNAWMRDNGPRYLEVDGQLWAQNWGFDAWGGGFGDDIPFAADDQIPQRVADHLQLPLEHVDLVHERGDLEFNGQDTVLLNWSVLGDPRRNPGLDRADAEAQLRRAFGVDRVIMIEGVPTGDLTGGHIDGIARFISDTQVVVADCSRDSVCQPGDRDDQIFDAASQTIADAGLEVIRWPFFGKVDYQGQEFDTAYMNWLVGNGFVIAVGFGHPDADAEAERRLGEWFPGREVYVIEMLESWAAGGGVHCHTNDQPVL